MSNVKYGGSEEQSVCLLKCARCGVDWYPNLDNNASMFSENQQISD